MTCNVVTKVTHYCWCIVNVRILLTSFHYLMYCKKYLYVVYRYITQ